MLAARGGEPSNDMPSAAARAARYRAHELRTNTSLPGGTGVCVVNTVDERAARAPPRGAMPCLDELAHALEHEERRVALVHVEDGRLDARASRARARRRRRAASSCRMPLLAVAAVERSVTARSSGEFSARRVSSR